MPSNAYRTTDPATSRNGAEAVKHRAPSQRDRLLRAFDLAGPIGLTDEEAAYVTRLSESRRACWWKRCSELRGLGFIAPTGEERQGDAGSARMVSAITDAGAAYMRGETK